MGRRKGYYSDSESSSEEVRFVRASPARERHVYERPQRDQDDETTDSAGSVALVGRGYNPRVAVRERAEEAVGLHDRTHIRGRRATGMVPVNKRVRQRPQDTLNPLTGQVQLYSSPQTLAPGVATYTDVEVSGGGKRTRTVNTIAGSSGITAAGWEPSVSGPHFTLHPSTLNQVKQARPLPTYPDDEEAVADWHREWEHAWEVHAYGLPESFHLDLLQSKLPKQLQEHLRQAMQDGRNTGRPITYSTYMDYLLSRQVSNPFMGRQAWREMEGMRTQDVAGLEEFQVRWNRALRKCADVSNEEVYTTLMGKLTAKLRRLVQDREAKLGERKFWATLVGRRVSQQSVEKWLQRAGIPVDKAVLKYATNATTVEFRDKEDLASFLYEAHQSRDREGKPYHFQSTPVRLTVEEVWVHLKDKLTLERQKQQSEKALKGRLEEQSTQGRSSANAPPPQQRSQSARRAQSRTRAVVAEPAVTDACPTAEVAAVQQSCFRCGDKGHWAADCKATENLCYLCHKPGHTRAECPKKSPEGEACLLCKSKGHKARTCPERSSHCFRCANAGRRSKHDHKDCKYAKQERDSAAKGDTRAKTAKPQSKK